MKLSERRIYSKYWNRLKQRRFPGYQLKVWEHLSKLHPISSEDLVRDILIDQGWDPDNKWFSQSYLASLKNLFDKKFVRARPLNGEVVYEPTFHGMWVMFLKSKRIV